MQKIQYLTYIIQNIYRESKLYLNFHLKKSKQDNIYAVSIMYINNLERSQCVIVFKERINMKSHIAQLTGVKNISYFLLSSYNLFASYIPYYYFFFLYSLLLFTRGKYLPEKIKAVDADLAVNCFSILKYLSFHSQVFIVVSSK